MALKNIPDSGFGDDQGAADPRLAQALAHYAEDRAAEVEVLAALTDARLLVPVVAVLGETATGPDGLRRDKTSEMAVPTLETAAGRRALPAFTGVPALTRWRSDARPVAVPARQAVAATFFEQADTLVIDVAGPVTFALSGAALRALGEGRVRRDPVDDPQVVAAVRSAVAAEPSVLRAFLFPGTPREVSRDGAQPCDAIVGLVLAADAPVPEVAKGVAVALASDEVLRSRLDHGLNLAFLPATGTLPGKPIYAR